ncbi:MAG: carboxypeptidase-like regulatory domain-containing protein [Oceanihabitans sp.]|nr:carboxypeptidase-like regulatory domain-containing protein [Oceanihabitans sp.]
MKNIILIFSFLCSLSLSAQTISGIVTDAKNNPIVQANVYLEGTYDGGTTNAKGAFSFKTEETGTQNLLVSFVGFETYTMLGDISYMKDLKIQLREDVNSLDTVVLSAGTFSAGDNSKVNALKPLDVVTTASALGDFVGALQTLPGTTTVAEDGRLFVRGGEAEETQIFIDGIKVFTPYSPTTNNTPTRGRYSPFLFDGITFSTGGYSAEYGQALSSVLLLNTTGEPDQEKTDIGIMTLGASLGNTQKWKNNSLSVNASYINLAPYNAVFKSRNDWKKPSEVASGEAVFRQKINNGMLKLYTAFEATNFELTQEDINASKGVHFKLKNNNLYFNGSYKGMLSDSWTLETGMSYTLANDKINIDAADIKDTENSFHGKVKLKHRFNNRFKLNFGAEYLATNFNENYQDTFTPKVAYGFNNNISAAFTEADIFFSRKLALKAGLRLEHSALFDEVTLSPRVSMAYKTSDKSQVSLAYGDFYQNPNSSILKFEQDLQAQQTSHYILNYQYNGKKQLFRAEAYYKDYDQLVKYDSDFASFDSNLRL